MLFPLSGVSHHIVGRPEHALVAGMASLDENTLLVF